MLALGFTQTLEKVSKLVVWITIGDLTLRRFHDFDKMLKMIKVGCFGTTNSRFRNLELRHDL